jgi:adenosylcobinamide amidohydrolase
MSDAMRLDLSPRWLVARFRREHSVLSSAVVRGGRRRARIVAWHEVRDDELPPEIDPVRLLRRRLADQGLRGAVGLLTSRPLGRYVVAERGYEGISARVVATVGLSNALRVGDPPDDRPRPGTINILCRVSRPLSESAQIEALALIAEARALAMLEASVDSRRSGLPSTGTGTDCIVLASPAVPGPDRYAGKHTTVGHVVGASVSDALRRGISAWLAERRKR